MSTDEATDEDERIRAIVQEELEKQDSLTSGTVPISRRGLLKGGAALGIGGLAGSVLSDGDSGRVAAAAAGQVGTDTDRVDVYGNVVDAASVSTGELVNVADTIVGTTSELESAFNNLSAGETIYVGQPDTSMEITQWLDINVSNVTIEFESPFAVDSTPAVKAASGSNVGGIRIGDSTAVNNITIRRFGFDGNHSNQDQSVKKLHGIKAKQAENLTIEGCFVTRTSPYHEHNSGGSGISAMRQCDKVWIRDNWVDDAGDRSIQTDALRATVTDNRCTNGFDRGISLQAATGTNETPRWSIAANNIIEDLSEGSAIGVQGESGTNESFIVANNIARGNMRNLVKVFDPAASVVITGNVGDATDVTTTADGITLKQRSNSSTVAKRFNISNNVLLGYDGSGILFDHPAENVLVNGNTIYNVSGRGIQSSGSVTNVGIVANYIIDAGNQGIGGDWNDCLIANNLITGCYAHAVRTTERTGGTGKTMIVGNWLDGNQTSGGPEMEIPDGAYIVGNTVNAVNGDMVFEGSGVNATYFANNNVADAALNINDGSILNGETLESASAESPQGSYPAGTLVRFTDTGDGSGTGTYLITRSGGSIQISSSA